MKSDPTIVTGVVTVPDGTYSGTWCGYTVTFTHNDKTNVFKTGIGIRGTARVKIDVLKGRPTVSAAPVTD